MTERRWLRAVEVVHRLPGRIRLRYRRSDDTTDAEPAADDTTEGD